ncbi:Protein of unknown function [Gryllus bimaculatus]|nr:Protein of unknown function [Gryllus bimaculatus]
MQVEYCLHGNDRNKSGVLEWLEIISLGTLLRMLLHFKSGAFQSFNIRPGPCPAQPQLPGDRRRFAQVFTDGVASRRAAPGDRRINGQLKLRTGGTRAAPRQQMLSIHWPGALRLLFVLWRPDDSSAQSNPSEALKALCGQRALRGSGKEGEEHEGRGEGEIEGRGVEEEQEERGEDEGRGGGEDEENEMNREKGKKRKKNKYWEERKKRR